MKEIKQANVNLKPIARNHIIIVIRTDNNHNNNKVNT